MERVDKGLIPGQALFRFSGLNFTRDGICPGRIDVLANGMTLTLKRVTSDDGTAIGYMPSGSTEMIPLDGQRIGAYLFVYDQESGLRVASPEEEGAYRSTGRLIDIDLKRWQGIVLPNKREAKN